MGQIHLKLTYVKGSLGGWKRERQFKNTSEKSKQLAKTKRGDGVTGHHISKNIVITTYFFKEPLL